MAPVEPVAWAKGHLFKYIPDADPPQFYVHQRDVTAYITCVDNFKFFLDVQVGDVYEAGKSVFHQPVPINNNMELQTWEVTNSFIWIAADGEGKYTQWSVAMSEEEKPRQAKMKETYGAWKAEQYRLWEEQGAKYEEEPGSCPQVPFLDTISECLYEANQQEALSKVPVVDREYVMGAMVQKVEEEEEYDEVDMMTWDMELMKIEENEQEKQRRLADRDDDDDAYHTAEDEEEVSRTRIIKSERWGKSSEPFSLLTDSAKKRRTYVVQGSDIAVVSRDQPDMDVVFIKDLKTPKGCTFTPSEIMLHEDESHIVALNAQDPTKLFDIDLSRGSVVDEWTVDKYDTIKVLNMAHSTKYGNFSGEKTFAVLGHNVATTLDPRLSTQAKAIAEDVTKYVQTSKPGFSCCATTANGNLVIGSAKGEIRLFKGVPGLPQPGSKSPFPKTAKTLLPGLGDPIVGIDVTLDGSWVLATYSGTPDYLLVVNTEILDSDVTGFSERMGPHKKVPKRLCLLPEDVLLVGGPDKVKFTPAKFNTGNGEMWIVTSVGEYIVVWNFRRIKHGHLHDYVIKKQSESIVAQQFVSVTPDEDGSRAPVVVATPNDVMFEKRVPCSPSSPYKSKRPRGLNVE